MRNEHNHCPMDDCDANQDGTCARRTGTIMALPGLYPGSTTGMGAFTPMDGPIAAVVAGNSLGGLPSVLAPWDAWRSCPYYQESKKRR